MRKEPTINQLAKRIGEAADEALSADEETRNNNYRLIRELAKIIEDSSEQAPTPPVVLQMYDRAGKPSGPGKFLYLATSND